MDSSAFIFYKCPSFPHAQVALLEKKHLKICGVFINSGDDSKANLLGVINAADPVQRRCIPWPRPQYEPRKSQATAAAAAGPSLVYPLAALTYYAHITNKPPSFGHSDEASAMTQKHDEGNAQGRPPEQLLFPIDRSGVFSEAPGVPLCSYPKAQKSKTGGTVEWFGSDAAGNLDSGLLKRS